MICHKCDFDYCFSTNSIIKGHQRSAKNAKYQANIQIQSQIHPLIQVHTNTRYIIITIIFTCCSNQIYSHSWLISNILPLKNRKIYIFHLNAIRSTYPMNLTPFKFVQKLELFKESPIASSLFHFQTKTLVNSYLKFWSR